MGSPGQSHVREASKPALVATFGHDGKPGPFDALCVECDERPRMPRRRYCVECYRERNNEANRKYNQTEGSRDRVRKYQRTTKGLKSAHRNKGGSHAHHFSKEEWLAIYHAQGGRCAICEKPLRNRFDPESEGQVAAMDHDHKIAKSVGPRLSTRGLLCTYPCNRLLVEYWTVERLERAAAYKRDLPAQRVLNALPTPNA